MLNEQRNLKLLKTQNLSVILNINIHFQIFMNYKLNTN